ncbi:hypothetical protein [Streptomyces sp. PR69]|uniref:hypothetical protein n=1 Tax=Streptomyces sp. PR69 TaxID=2984950 RepID=UPI002263BB0D|nr:hypothetical protein [Streptomyces sp. PR69]
MAIPAGVETVTVGTGGVPLTLPDGTPIRGSIRFSAPDLVTVAEDDYALGGTVSVELVGGEFSVVLVATDATGISPTGWTYTVEARLTNAPGWTRYLSLPAGTPTVVLADVLITDPVSGAHDTLVVEKTRTAVKTADQSVTSSIAVVDDDHLTLTVEANSVYAFDTYLDADGDTGGDLRLTFTGPAGASGSWTPDGISLGNANNIGQVKRSRNALAAEDSVGILPAGTIVTPSGQITTGGTAGALTLRWAQDTSSATPTRLLAGSWLRVTKLA